MNHAKYIGSQINKFLKKIKMKISFILKNLLEKFLLISRAKTYTLEINN